MKIIGKRLTILMKNGERHDFTHVEQLVASGEHLDTVAEADGGDGMRERTYHIGKLDQIHMVIFEPYIPKE